MIMAAADLLERNPNPTEEEIRHGLEGNLCRCTGYHNIVKAVQVPRSRRQRASGAVRGGERAMRRAHEQPRRAANGHVGQADEAPQGGPAADHRQRPATSTTSGPPGMLHAAIVRSPEAHASIASIDTSRGRGAPRRAWPCSPATDLRPRLGPLPMVWVPPGVEVKTPEHWPLARGEVVARRRSGGRGGGRRTSTPSSMPPRT